MLVKGATGGDDRSLLCFGDKLVISGSNILSLSQYGTWLRRKIQEFLDIELQQIDVNETNTTWQSFYTLAKFFI